MTESNNKITDNESKNFITENDGSGGLKFKISQELTSKITKRRSNQYIAGEIISVFPYKEYVMPENVHGNVYSKGIKTYFLILCNKFNKTYLICPLFRRSILSCATWKDYEVSLGVIKEIEETKLLYADISRCHYINKDEFHDFIFNQVRIMRDIGEDFNVYKLEKEKFRAVIKKFKMMISV